MRLLISRNAAYDITIQCTKIYFTIIFTQCDIYKEINKPYIYMIFFYIIAELYEKYLLIKLRKISCR